MKLEIKHGLPFIEAVFFHRGNKRIVPNILIDTGSVTTLLSVEVVLELGLEPELTDNIQVMRGIGGKEYVYEKKIDKLVLGLAQVQSYTLQIGDMDYGLDINGIIGADFLMEAKIIIDMAEKELYVKHLSE